VVVADIVEELANKDPASCGIGRRTDDVVAEETSEKL
jgi:hypothetical protein